MKIKKMIAVILSVAIVVCMFAVPAGAEDKLPVTVYVENTGKELKFYFDGLGTDAFKKYVTPKIKEYDSDGYSSYIPITLSLYYFTDYANFEVGISYDMIKKDNNWNYDVEARVSPETGYASVNKYLHWSTFKMEKYSINKNGLTKGYYLTIPDEKFIEEDWSIDKLSFTSYSVILDNGYNELPVKELPLSAPTIKATAKKNKLTLSWNKVSGAEKYQVCCSTDGGKTYKALKELTKTSATITLKKGSSYKFAVRSYKTVNGKKVYSKFSNVKSVKY